jgi:hypothetical protein
MRRREAANINRTQPAFPQKAFQREEDSGAGRITALILHSHRSLAQHGSLIGSPRGQEMSESW